MNEELDRIASQIAKLEETVKAWEDVQSQAPLFLMRVLDSLYASQRGLQAHARRINRAR